MEPAEALQTAENALRIIVRQLLGDSWQQDGDHIERLRAKREEDAKRRDGAVVADDLLSYVEFNELARIILKHWDSAFHAVFEDKTRTKVWLETLGDVRNAIAHSRQLMGFERDLAAGISGQLRNQITIFRTAREPASMHYPVIESVRDSYGQVGAESHGYDLLRSGVEPMRLDVGELLSFECQGSDYRGRDLEWILVGYIDMNAKTLSRATGASATLQWRVDEDLVGEKKLFSVRMRAAGARHFRSTPGWGEESYDDFRTFHYSVNPPYD